MKPLGLAAVLGVALASSQAPAPSASTAFAVRNVRVFDGARALAARTVVVVDGRIVAVGSDGVAMPPGAQQVDGAGRTLLPGLIDTHVHLSPIFPREALQQSLAFGVTTVIDMWTGPPPRGFAGAPALARLKEIETSDPADLSAIQTAGTGATARGGHPTQMDGGWAALVTPSIDAPAQAEAFVTARLLEGSDFIKIVDDDTMYSFGRTLPTLSKASLTEWNGRRRDAPRANPRTS
jgi:cytosine/adenosine deaminase-related metal-dependent hydrolase